MTIVNKVDFVTTHATIMKIIQQKY